MLMMITMIRARVGFPQKSIAWFMMPRSNSKPLKRPFFANIFETYSREINCGMAMVMIRTVRHSFFSLMPFLLIIMATRIPRK